MPEPFSEKAYNNDLAADGLAFVAVAGLFLTFPVSCEKKPPPLAYLAQSIPMTLTVLIIER